MKCDVKTVARLHPSIKIGGVTMGHCQNEALPGFVVCFEHVNKEALWLMVQSERQSIQKKDDELAHSKQVNALLVEQIRLLQKDVRGKRYKKKSAKKAERALLKDLNKLKVSKEVKDILFRIAVEVGEAWQEQLMMFKHVTTPRKQ